FQECWYGSGLFRFLVDHHGHSDSAIRVAAAADLTPVVLWSVNLIRPVRECAHKRDREPVANRLADSGLILDIVGEMRQSIALRKSSLVRHRFVAAGERYRLEREKRDAPGIVHRKLNDFSDLLVVDSVDDGRNRNDLDAVAVQVFDCAKLD